MLQLNMVRRVASNPFGMRHQARVKVTGDRFQVWVNGHSALDAHDATFKSGRIGLAGFASWQHGKVIVAGSEVDGGSWNDAPQVKNWFVPFPGVGGQQGGIGLSRTPKGDLLCTFSSGQKRFLARSKDKGRTWTVANLPENLMGSTPGDQYYACDLRLLRDGRLMGVFVGTKGGSWTESKDDGVTWEKPTPIKADGWPKDPENIATSWMIELADGALVRFGLGKHSTSTDPVTKWGAVHCQAFSTGSTDGGKTWSAPVNLDTSRPDMGSLDLTEPVGFETKGGSIMVLIRPIYSPWMWETWSADKGRNWSPCVRGPFPGYAPSTPVRTASGAVIFPTRFPGLTMHSTRDEGKTWDEGGGGTYLDTSIWAMGSMIEVEPNLVLHIHMDSWGGPARARFLRITPQGIEPATEVLPKP